MNWKRYGTTVLVIFLAANVTGFLIHGYLLKDDYGSVPNAAQVYRTAADTKYLFISLAYLGFALATVWLYAKGVEAKPWLGQGLRFGAAVWLAVDVVGFLTSYAVQPLPESLVAKQLALEFVAKLLLGALTAALYRGSAAGKLRTSSAAA